MFSSFSIKRLRGLAWRWYDGFFHRTERVFLPNSLPPLERYEIEYASGCDDDGQNFSLEMYLMNGVRFLKNLEFQNERRGVMKKLRMDLLWNFLSRYRMKSCNGKLS